MNNRQSYNPRKKESKMYKRLAEKITKLIIDALKKEKLLEMANDGLDRPANGKTRLRQSLSKYAKPVAYDAEFAEMIKGGKVHAENGKVKIVRAKSTPQDPELAEHVRKRNPHWFRPDSLEVVVRMMLDADSNPARKAQADRALKSYSRKRAAEIRSTPKRVTAGVRAAVTKRRQKAK